MCVFVSQVDNAATKGASAVLIYPDSQDYQYNKNTALYGHVSLQHVVGADISKYESHNNICLFIFLFRSIWAQVTPILQDFPPSTTLSSLQLNLLASPESQLRP